MWSALAASTSESINVSHLPYAGLMNYNGSRTLSQVIVDIQDRLDALEETVESL